MQAKREVKFRVWDKQNKEMIYQKPLSLTKFMITIDGDFGWFDFERQIWSGIIPKAFIELQQFTGLYDKNGAKIYEGDIVSLSIDDETRLFEVAIETVVRDVVSHPSFDGATARVAITGVVFKWKGFELFPCINKGIPDNLKMEVIGNIHENPEYLEVSDNASWA
ncbi:YopX family protein [Brevibacillus fortis]|uniref:YopX protein domain-containing protein n=1 Tax=Brevibacillus fortis TaxID=2126352 RepID=A0A2P7V3P6_9BACL|nr:YopX family protein [Brevibacillus fortis]PSJ93864.1 hypothetical protein C7R93_16920 [Brevibacillus fortis]